MPAARGCIFGAAALYSRFSHFANPAVRNPEVVVIRAMRWRLCRLAAVAGLAWMAGCSHPCGYVDLHSQWTVLGEGRASTAPLAQPLQIERGISERNAVLEVRVESLETTEGLVRSDLYGKPTYVEWVWYHPLLKLPVAVTILPPFYLAFRVPHTHSGGNWSRWDYFRDVIAWFNLASAVPTGPREIRAEEALVRSKKMTAILSQRRAPLAGRGVSLSLDGRELASAVSDAQGEVRFDLAPFLTPELAQGSHTLRLVSPYEVGGAVEYTWKLDGAVVGQYLENRKQAPEPKAPPPGP